MDIVVHSLDISIVSPAARQLTWEFHCLDSQPIYATQRSVFNLFDFSLVELFVMEMHDTLSMESEGGHTILPNNQSLSTKNLFMAMVPIEVYQNIFQFVGKEGLAALSRVSHTFQHEAEYILYEVVNLTLGDHRTGIISWCTAVTNVKRRAHRVHSLRFPPRFPPASESPSSTTTPEDLDKLVAQAFNAVVNLKHLYFFGTGDYPVSLYPSTLKDCTFSLSSFVGQVSSFTPQDQIDLLIKHPKIEYWVPTQPFLLSVTSFPKAMLPRLRELVLTHPALTCAFKGRPIEALVLFFIGPMHTRAIGLEAVVPLGFFEDTLHTLDYIHGRLTEDWSTADIIDTLAEKTPNLRSLSFTSLGNDDSVMAADKQQSLVDAISRFRHLETLSLNTDMGALGIPNDESPDPSNPLECAATWKDCSPAQSRKIAIQFMTACPSLKRLCFPKSRSADSGCLTYVRSKLDGSIGLDGFYRIDTSKWWMR